MSTDRFVDRLRQAARPPAPVVGVVTATSAGTATVRIAGTNRTGVVNPSTITASIGDPVEVSTRGVWTITRKLT